MYIYICIQRERCVFTIIDVIISIINMISTTIISSSIRIISIIIDYPCRGV